MNKLLRFGMALMLVLIMFTCGALTAFAYGDHPTDGSPDDCDNHDYYNDYDEYVIEYTPDISEEDSCADDMTEAFPNDGSPDDYDDYDDYGDCDEYDECVIEYTPDISEEDSCADYPTEANAADTSVYIMAEPLTQGQVSTFAELRDAVNSATNGVEKRIEVIADFPFETTIQIRHGTIITLYTGGDIHNLTAPSDERHFTVLGTLNLQGGVSLVGNGGNGGGVDNSGTLNMSGNSSITGNLNRNITGAAYGGGVRNGGTFTMTDDASISGNTVQSDSSAAYGGGIYFSNGTITLSGNAKIINNTAISGTSVAYGGGIYQHGGVVNMTGNAAIVGNNVRSDAGSTAAGGGIYSGHTSTLNISDNASIRDNRASSGGGVWMSYGNSVMTLSGNASVADNSASGSGGGVHLGFNSTLHMEGGSITGNTAQNGAGVSSASYSFVYISAGIVSGNTALQNGGGVLAELANLTVGESVVFSGNRADMAFPYRNPSDDAIYEQNIWGTNWTYPFTQGYNNFDIGYHNVVVVTFDGNGGSPSQESRRIAFGTAIGSDMPSDPTRADYIFSHWCIRSDGTGDTFDGETVITGNMTVFAIWEAVPTPQPTIVTVYFNGNGGNVLPENQTRQTVIGNPLGDYMPTAVPVREGYNFIGWNTAQNGTGHSFTDATVVNADITVFAQWCRIQTPPPAERQGSLLVTVIAENGGERIPGVSLSVYHSQTNVVIATLITDMLGEAFMELPIGDYSLRQTAVPSGFILNHDRIALRITENRLTEVTVRLRQIPAGPETESPPPTTPRPTLTPSPSPTPTPVTPTSQSQPPAQNQTPPAPPSGSGTPTAPSTQSPATVGNVQIIARAEQSGNLLQGAVFAVYRVSDNTRISQLATDENGQVTHQLAPGEYYLRQQRAIFGYLPETARIFFTVEDGKTVVVEVTNQRDKDAPYAEGDNITLPQTGEMPPVMNYVIGALLLVLAMLCGIGMVCQRKPKKCARKNRKGKKVYA